MSIRARLLVTLLAGVSLALAAGGMGLYLFTASRLNAEFRAALLGQAKTLASTVVIDHGEVEIEASTAKSQSAPMIYRIVESDGSELAGAGTFEWEDGPPALPGTDSFVWAEVELPGDEDGLAVIYGFHPAIETDGGVSAGADDRTSRVVWITAVRSTRSLEGSIAILGSAITGFGVLLLGTTAILVWIGVRAGLRPLDRYVESIESLDPATLEWPAPPPGTPDELRPAYEALAEAVERVSDAMERERRFTDAAAHELRTPVSELRTLLDVANRWPEPERIARSLTRAGDVLANMTNLIESLLILSRAGSNTSERESDQESMRKIVADEHERLCARAESNGVSVTVGHDADWQCPRMSGQIIVRNLLENAIEYTPRNGSVDIHISQRALRISNGPVSLTIQQAEQMFEPFWRADDSRTDRRHHGLGLTIVRHAAAASGLTCRAEVEGDTLTITVEAEKVPHPSEGEHHD
jgi:signal transduction histidine kinase